MADPRPVLGDDCPRWMCLTAPGYSSGIQNSTPMGSSADTDKRKYLKKDRLPMTPEEYAIKAAKAEAKEKAKKARDEISKHLQKEYRELNRKARNKKRNERRARERDKLLFKKKPGPPALANSGKIPEGYISAPALAEKYGRAVSSVYKAIRLKRLVCKMEGWNFFVLESSAEAYYGRIKNWTRKAKDEAKNAN